VIEWIEGRLEPRLLSDRDASAVALRSLRRDIAATVTALDMDDAETYWCPNSFAGDDAARWCWIRPWALSSQDEDLLLMEDELVERLLGEAAADCPKRDQAIQIAEHHVRDRAHASLVDASRERTAMRALVRFRPSAVAARAEQLVAYLDRLASYDRIAAVTQDEARLRVADFTRCAPPQSVQLEKHGAEWWARADTAPAAEHWIVIDERTGAARVERSGPRRAS
jgi:hypothetical protein